MSEIGTSASNDDDIALLGDPSGRQDEEYWNSWFLRYHELKNKEASGPQDNVATPFEWYCSADEVVRVLSLHLRKPSNKDCLIEGVERDNEKLRIVHPGSGTSLVPRRLVEKHPEDYRHVVVDVSPVAIEQAKQVLGEEVGDWVEFLVDDLLSDHANEIFPDSHFAAWIDKGFLDAVFSSTSPHSQCQAERLFLEAQRLLCESGGVAIIVSLAEDHSLSYIVRNGWLSWFPSRRNTVNKKNWSRTLHVHELEPTSGTMRPFAFVMTTTATEQYEEESSLGEDGFRVAWHGIDSNHAAEILEITRETAYSILQERVERSRSEFAKLRRQKSASRKNRVLAVIDVKPHDPDVDLESLGRRIAGTKWRPAGDSAKSLEIVWQPADPTNGRGVASNGDDDCCFCVISIGFGISKLRMSCVVDADELEELVAVIEEDLDEYVQSIDVDWQLTVPVGDTRDFLQLPHA